MDHALAKMIAERVSAGLQRKSLTTCSRWSTKCRIMGKPYPGAWSFKHHPWLKEMHDSEAEMNVGQKSAQMGYTETALNRTFFMIDVKGVDCLYVLPASNPDASDFSSGRFNPALELSPHLTNLFSDVQNVGHKRAGSTNLYVRGSKSRSGLKSIPVGFIVLDEVDEMEQDHIPLALERAAGQVEKQVWAISTPTIPGTGINKLYDDTSKEHFFFRCPACSRMTELVFPACLEITGEEATDEEVANSFLKCKECKVKLHHETKAEWLADNEWVPARTNMPGRGFHVNQLYSTTVPPAALARSYLKAQRDPAEEQEFFNSKLGLPHIVEGASVTDEHLQKSTGNFKKFSARPSYGVITMGVDVGRWLHVEIDQWEVPGGIASSDLNVRSRPRVIWEGKLQHFEELDNLMLVYNVGGCVIDANPERRKAYEFACRFHGLIKLCFYAQGVIGKQITVPRTDEGRTMIDHAINVDRTSWLDLSLGRFRAENGIKIPLDCSSEYKAHMKSLVRVYEKDRNGNQVGRYVKESTKDDHFAHSRNYAEIALQFAMSMANPQDITGY